MDERCPERREIGMGDLLCSAPEGHPGPHLDRVHKVSWRPLTAQERAYLDDPAGLFGEDGEEDR